ncbi:MAG: tetratricopeptide repeat protein [Anaerolineae bacterium]|nr:tetratricopeptide repeat protein [Anaerolineae bacterium]
MVDSTKPWGRDPLYYQGLQASQTGDWQRAAQAFSRLLEQYSADEEAKAELQPLLEDARLRMSLDQQYAAKVAKPRRKPIPVGRLLVWSAILVLAVALVYVLVASRQPAPVEGQTVDVEATTEAVRGGLLAQARSAVAAGDYAQAIAILQDLLSRFPLDEEIKGLLQWANQRWQLANLYQQAQEALVEQNWAGAVALLEEIQAQDPGYRDVPGLLEQARLGQSMEVVWQQAQEVYAHGNWQEAAFLYDSIRRAYPNYRREEVMTRLYHCYMSLGLEAVESAEGQPEPISRAVEYFAKALTYRPGDMRATTERRLAQTFLPAQQAFAAEKLDEAIPVLQTIYDARFNYMRGSVAQMLYDAYVARALRHELNGDLYLALQDYAAAERITGPDTSAAAQKRLELAMFLTPTPAPPTPTPFIWNPNLIPTQPPEPTPVPLAEYKGQIAFWTDREGVTQIFLMNPDGTDQRPANLARWGATEFDDLRKREMVSPDGKWQLYVARGNNRIAQIWVQELVNGSATGNNKQLTSLDNVCYDPVWSPDGWHVAFVSEHTGSDDIWTMTADGQNVTQLTKNDWEWEKHPSWSPDGQQIVYWSNKDTGHQQIWIMNADGSDQRNLSNNEYNDWNPIWIK